ncbi:CoA-transferase subunit beta [Oscillibacter sp.]|uniref:CoA-transferase subunit beta n=1 Tax=Oscillibacter sp. TaxID=1945593 RepID=UPI002D806691|nr:CoA-transferase [Oscillibacter sp.]
MEWTAKQMMAVALARQVEDGKTYIIGTGLPLIGAALAKNTHAPNARLIFETALFEGAPQEVPTSVSDLRINHQASVLWPQYRYFGFQVLAAGRGGIDAGFLGGAQIDPYGNLNSTCIGSYLRPRTRFTGSGGANGIATYCNTIITMKHEKRRFVEKVDYVTSPGWIDGPEGRARHGLPSHVGPQAVITELGVMRFDPESRRMYLAEYYPGVSVSNILENTGFELDVSRAGEAAPPSGEVLEVLVRQVDPMRLMI